MTHPQSSSPGNETETETCPCSPGCAYTGGPLSQAFFRFYRDNPAVLRRLHDELVEWRATVGRLCSVDMLMHHVRWTMSVEQRDGDFKISNSHVAFYARVLAFWKPELAESFRTRSAPEADAWAAHLAARSAVAA